MIGLAVVIEEKRHVARHLALGEIAAADEISGKRQGIGWPAGKVIFGQFGFLPVIQGPALVRGKVIGPDAGVGAQGAEVAKRSGGPVGHGHAAAGAVVALAFDLKVKPHDKLASPRVEQNFGPLQDAAGGDLAGRVGRDRQGNALILPVIKVLGRIGVNADLGGIARFPGGLVFPVPIENALVPEDAAAVGV
jgi:hypothetical protein